VGRGDRTYEGIHEDASSDKCGGKNPEKGKTEGQSWRQRPSSLHHTASFPCEVERRKGGSLSGVMSLERVGRVSALGGVRSPHWIVWILKKKQSDARSPQRVCRVKESEVFGISPGKSLYESGEETLSRVVFGDVGRREGELIPELQGPRRRTWGEGKILDWR